MFFQFQVFFYSLLFWGILESLSTDFVGSLLSDNLWIVLLTIFLLFVYIYQIAKRVSRRASMTPMPIVFVAASMGILYFIDAPNQQQVMMALSALIYYFIHLAFYRLRTCKTDQTAYGIVAAGSLAAIFLFYAVSYGIYLNFNIPLWFLMLALMMVSMLISFQYFWLVNENKKNIFNYSLVMGLVMAEIVWVLNFWPFGYLTTGVITLIFYYVFWDLVQCHFLHELSKRRVVGNMIFFGILVALVLSSTRWLPVV